MDSVPPAAPPLSLESRFPGRADWWQLRTRGLRLDRRPLVMGIVNVTPDSFSDGGLFADSTTAIEHAFRLAAEGADIIDVGGESTRPGSESVDANTELARVIPVLAGLRDRLLVPLSIDTSKAVVAREALAAGAEIVNDITGLEGDPRMIEVVRSSGCGVCLMHMRGTPRTMQDNPTYENVVEEVLEYLRSGRQRLIDHGIDARRIALDPGIGFGKTHQHNLTLLAHCHRFHALRSPLLVGHSRKGVIGKILGDKEADRTAGTVGVALALANQGVQIVRVHNVAAVRQALVAYEAVGGIDGQVLNLDA